MNHKSPSLISILVILTFMISFNACQEDPTSDENSPPSISMPSPTDEATSVPTTTDISWHADDPDDDSLYFDLFFGTDSNLGFDTFMGSGTNTNYDPGVLDRGTTYYWRIIADDKNGGVTEGPTWSFTTNHDASVSSPQPPHGETGVHTDIDLTWESSDPDSNTLEFTVYFGTEYYPDQNVPEQVGGSHSFTPDTLSPDTWYYWQVTVDDGISGPIWGPRWSFQTNCLPVASTNQYPSDGMINTPTTLSLSWEFEDPNEDELSYDVYLGVHEILEASDLLIEDLMGTTLDVNALSSGTTYYWKVIADDRNGGIAEGPTWSFRTIWDLGTPPSNPSHGDEWTAYLGEDQVPLVMIYIQGGTFEMGSPDTEQYRDTGEGPVHTVTISQGFWMGKYEVTQAQWETVMGTWEFYFDGNPTHPAEKVSWVDIYEVFLQILNAGEESNVWRLPTETEWEYSARAGTSTRYYWGDDLNETEIGNYAWYEDNSSSTTHPVGQKQPNAWGLYDMSGNVKEWCQDWYGSYSSSPTTDPTGPSTGSSRVLRGGGWSGYAGYCRSASRLAADPLSNDYRDGFRLLRSGE